MLFLLLLFVLNPSRFQTVAKICTGLFANACVSSYFAASCITLDKAGKQLKNGIYLVHLSKNPVWAGSEIELLGDLPPSLWRPLQKHSWHKLKGQRFLGLPYVVRYDGWVGPLCGGNREESTCVCNVWCRKLCRNKRLYDPNRQIICRKGMKCLAKRWEDDAKKSVSLIRVNTHILLLQYGFAFMVWCSWIWHMGGCP